MNKPKPRLLAAMLLLFTTHSFAQSFTGTTWSKAQADKKGTIRLSYVETPRFVYRDPSNNLTGICVDIMHDFVEWVSKNKSVDLKMEFVGEGASFNNMFGKVKESHGGVFGLGNITITNERKKEVKFSPPFITNFAILVSNGQLPVLNDMKDISTTFKGAHPYTAKGTINENRMTALKKEFYPEMKLNYTTSSQETLDKIVADAAGFGYLDLAFYLEGVQLKKNIKRHPVGDKAAEQFGFIMPMNSDWGSVMDEFFKANGGYMTTDRYRSILHKHLGEAGMKLLKTSSAKL